MIETNEMNIEDRNSEQLKITASGQWGWFFVAPNYHFMMHCDHSLSVVAINFIMWFFFGKVHFVIDELN